LKVSERRACAAIGQHRSTQRKRPQGRPDEDALTADIIRLASQYGRYGSPDHIRSDNGAAFTAIAVREWLARIGVKTLFIEPGSPWENGYNESFNGKPRDELLNTEIFYTLKEAKVLIERWRQHYNTIRPHSSLGYRPPAPEAILPRPVFQAYATLQPAQQGINPRRTLS
jgi:putative transposase